MKYWPAYGTLGTYTLQQECKQEQKNLENILHYQNKVEHGVTFIFYAQQGTPR